MNKRFLGKTIVITGASSGIGAATARQFADEGAAVVLAARRRESLESVAREIGGDKSLVVPTDVTDLAGAAALLEKAHERFGRIDVLINNAGAHAMGPTEERRVDELTVIVDVNLRAVVALCRMVLPYLRRAGGGAIVNVASLAGRVPLPGAATYCATKFGVRAFSRSLAEELAGSGITVSVVSPGPVDTEFLAGDINRVPDMVFSPPMSSPEQVARAIVACACNGKFERTIPRWAGCLTTLNYVFPQFARVVRPVVEMLGKSNRRRYLRSRLRY